MQLSGLLVDGDVNTYYSKDLYLPFTLVLANLDSILACMLSLLQTCSSLTSMKLSIILRTML